MTNVPLPPDPAPGQPLQAAWGATLLRWCRANALLPVPGMFLTRTSNGTSLRPRAAPLPAPPTAQTTFPWQPYAAPYTGSGTIPADWALNIMLRTGTVSDGVGIWEPSNAGQVFKLDPSTTTGFRIWLDATISGTATVTSLSFGSGAKWPTAQEAITDEKGTPPAHVYCPLLVINSSQTAADLTNAVQLQNAALFCRPTIVSQLNGLMERRMFYYGNASNVASA